VTAVKSKYKTVTLLSYKSL